MSIIQAAPDRLAAALSALSAPRLLSVGAVWLGLGSCIAPGSSGDTGSPPGDPRGEVVTQPAPPLLEGKQEAEEGAAVEPQAVAGQGVGNGATSEEEALAAAELDVGGAEAAAEGAAKASRAALEREAARVLDDWHDAASKGDRDRYIGHFSPDAIFLGTDATERWDLATFTSYVEEHFRPGAGWTYTPSNRHVMLSEDGSVAWFDEALTSSGYGALRGTGALRRLGDSWQIAHYSMTFTVPNDIARDVVQIVRQSGG